MSKGKRISEKEKELKSLLQEQTGVQDVIEGLKDRETELQKQIKSLENDLRQMKPKDLVVSDHVVLRYLERNHGIGVEEVRQEIRELLAGAETMSDLKIGGFIVRGNTVVTYVGKGRWGT